MPLTAQADGLDIAAFQLSDEQWEQLSNSTLQTRCCGRTAHRRTSKLGTRHFVHHRRGECTTAPESAEHLALKEQIAITAQAAGWDVTLEAQHGQFVVDVEARHGDEVFAFEVQWSRQGAGEYERRSRLYEEAGIELVWLVRPPSWDTIGIAPSRSVWLEKPSDGERVPTHVRMPGRYPPFAQPLGAFVMDVLSARACWRERIELVERPHALIVEIPETCWKCSKAATGHLVGGVAACCGHIEPPPLYQEATGDLVRRVQQRGWLLADTTMPIEWRSTRTSGSSYFANVCPHCSAVSGDHFLARQRDERGTGSDGRPRGVYQVPCTRETIASLYNWVLPQLERAHWCLPTAPPIEHELEHLGPATRDEESAQLFGVEVNEGLTPQQAINRMFGGRW